MTFDELEKTRVVYKSKVAKIRNWAFAIATIALVLLGFPALRSGSGFAAFAVLFYIFFFIFIVTIIVIAFATRKEAAAYSRAYKAYFVSRSLSATFSNVTYIPNQGMPYEVISRTGMMYMGDRYNSNDFVSGNYKNISFCQADVHIEREDKDSDGDTTYVTTFRGRWMIFDFHRDFAFNLQVAHKNFGSSRAYYGKGQRKFEKIEVESPTFNKKFVIYGQDGFEAFYILDPAFIERIEKLGDECGGRIMLCFINQKLHIALYNGKDAFEPPRYSKPIDEKAEFEKVSHDIKAITNFVDDLNLDKNVFKK